MSSVTWHCLHHRQLDTATLYELLALRTQVFVVEQNCPYLETDGQDLIGDTCHLLAREGNALVGYLRLLDPQRMDGEVVKMCIRDSPPWRTHRPETPFAAPHRDPVHRSQGAAGAARKTPA